jgi:thiol:disulfide interchange protein DsbD
MNIGARLAVLGFVLLPVSALSAPVAAPHVQVELMADAASVQPGRDVSVGVRFVLEDGWHVYWRNPGDSGEPPTVMWTVPPGFSTGELEWPRPERIAVGPLVNFGYEGSTLLASELHVPPVLAAPSVDVGAEVKWLVCSRDECIPGEAPLSLTLPVAPALPAPSPAKRLFDEARARLPVPVPDAWRLAATATPDSVTLQVQGADGPLTRHPLFFPFARDAIEHAAPQAPTLTKGGFQLSLAPWSQARAPLASLAGVLTVGDRAYAVAIPVGSAGVDPYPLVLAFAGGLLLNLMPCVFPVLALKALALMGLASEDRRRMRFHGVVYALGVVASFWALAGVLLAARATGAELGWGFQLQSPVVVAVLASLFFWMALTLLGVSSVGGSIMGVGSRLAVGGGYRAAFFTGVLATVVATPCTAPFMGTALGYALVQPAVVALGVFTSLALGLAAPYVAITFVPALGRYLPRPGRWMETLKQALAFPLLATVVWLVWVASLQAGPAAVVAILAALLLLAFAAWMVEHWPARWSRVVAAVVVAGAIGLEATIVPLGEPAAAGSAALAWEPYSAARLGELLGAGRPVFVDFTAAWCVTCQVNERLALATPSVTAKMRALGVVPVRADWTRPNPDVTRALRQFGRDGVPLYVLYSGRKEDPPRILPQILTTETVLSELEQLETRSRI